MLETNIKNLTAAINELSTQLKSLLESGWGRRTTTAWPEKSDIIFSDAADEKEEGYQHSAPAEPSNIVGELKEEITYPELNKIALKIVEAGKLTDARVLLGGKYNLSSLQDASPLDYAAIKHDLLALMV